MRINVAVFSSSVGRDPPGFHSQKLATSTRDWTVELPKSERRNQKRFQNDPQTAMQADEDVSNNSDFVEVFQVGGRVLLG
jgi:hypothetical protein